MAKKNIPNWIQITAGVFLALLFFLVTTYGIKLFYPSSETQFYIYGGIGLLFILLGLFIPILLARVAGMGSGFVLIITGIVINRNSTLSVFIGSVVLIIVILLAIFLLGRKYGKS